MKSGINASVRTLLQDNEDHEHDTSTIIYTPFMGKGCKFMVGWRHRLHTMNSRTAVKAAPYRTCCTHIMMALVSSILSCLPQSGELRRWQSVLDTRCAFKPNSRVKGEQISYMSHTACFPQPPVNSFKIWEVLIFISLWFKWREDSYSKSKH